MLGGRVSRRLAHLSFYVPGYTRTIRYAREHSLGILMYHGLVSRPLQMFNWGQLEVSRFQEQIEFLTLNYRLLPLREALHRLCHKRALPDRAVAVTFDDGYRSVYTTAFPVLEHYQVPFTLFLITGLVGSHEPAWPEQLFSALVATKAQRVHFGQADWPLMTTGQREAAYRAICSRLKRMDVSKKDEALGKLQETLGGVTTLDSAFDLLSWDEIYCLHRTGLADFGSHTHTHQILSRCDLERQRSELCISRDILQQKLEKADLFAYPNGGEEDFTELTTLLVKELGYRCGLTTIQGLNSPSSNLYELRRVGVGANHSLADFEMRLLGL